TSLSLGATLAREVGDRNTEASLEVLLRNRFPESPEAENLRKQVLIIMPQEDQVPRRVGERLRQAREQQGIAIADAAERLHILASYIKALESGRYGVLPGTVFLRGYVRSYARLLQLDADEIVAQLDRELGTADESQTGL